MGNHGFGDEHCSRIATKKSIISRHGNANDETIVAQPLAMKFAVVVTILQCVDDRASLEHDIFRERSQIDWIR